MSTILSRTFRAGQHTVRRTLATSTRFSAPADYTSRPGPPPLPAAQQREFEELLRRVNAPASKPAPGVEVEADSADVDELVMHPDFRSKPKPRFEGDTNPTTGEVGGPKNEPLEHGDWSYGGKCTDF
ncbi:DUF1674 domain protein [Pseudohyphozyma bogoriensis]|nr:DUF1674 domain protein [Pseudohyphozyma bogoriensis]